MAVRLDIGGKAKRVVAGALFGQLGIAGRQRFDRAGDGRFGLAAQKQDLVPERVDLLVRGVSLH